MILGVPHFKTPPIWVCLKMGKTDVNFGHNDDSPMEITGTLFSGTTIIYYLFGIAENVDSFIHLYSQQPLSDCEWDWPVRCR
jgi:hypothetical protein